MRPTRRILALAGSLAMAGILGAEPREARAQVPVYSSERVFTPTGPVMTRQSYVVAPAPVVTTYPTYVVSGRPVYRTERRRFALRPDDYGGRRQLSFGPYSDSYPKTVPLRPTYDPAYPR